MLHSCQEPSYAPSPDISTKIQFTDTISTMSDHVIPYQTNSDLTSSNLVSSIVSDLISPHFSLLSSLPSRLSFARSFYPDLDLSTFIGGRDLYRTFGYDSYVTLQQYRFLFERGGIATRIVSSYPEDTWSDGFDVYSDTNSDIDTPFEQEIRDLFTRLDFLAKCERLDILAGIGHYGVLLLNFADIDFKASLPKTFTSDKLISLLPLDELRAKIIQWDKNESSPRFGLPELYRVQIGSKSNPISKDVHHSHIFHFVDSPLESDLFGTPRLRAVWNDLIDLIKLKGSGAEAAFRRQDPGMHISTPLFDKDGKRIKVDKKQKDEIAEKIADYRDGVSKEIYSQGLDIQLLNSNVSNFGPNVDSIMDQIAGASKIPKRKLMGSEQGKLAADQDSKGYDANCNRRKQRLAIPFIRRFINFLIDARAISQVEEYFVDPITTESIPPQEQTAIALRMAQTNQAQSLAGGSIVYTENEIRDIATGLEPLDDTIDPNDPNENDPALDNEDDSADPSTGGARSNLHSYSNLISITPLFLDSDPEWKLIHKVADSHRPILSRELRSSWKDSADNIDSIQLLSAIERNDSNKIHQILISCIDNLTLALIPTIQSRIQETMGDAGRIALRAARKRGSWYINSDNTAKKPVNNTQRSLLEGPFSMSFNEVNPRAVTFALTRSSTLVSQITPDTLKGLQHIISQSLLDGVPPRRQVNMIKQWVGLRLDQVKTVENFSAKLLAAKPGSIVNAGRSFSVKIPRKGITTDFLHAQQDKYAEKLLRQRSLLIARTETARSAQAGQVELWQQGIENGLLPDTIMRLWLVTDDERLREAHAEMEGAIAKINEPFSPIPEPGWDYQCRCGQGLTED